MFRAVLSYFIALPSLAAVTGTSAFLQAPAPPGFNWNGASSYFSPGETIRRDFAEGVLLSSESTVSSLRFWGRNIGSFPVASTQFRISVWRSDGLSSNGISGSPGTLHFEEIVSISDPRMEVFLYPGPLQGSDRYEINFGSAFTMNANERYWIAIAGSTEPNQDFRWGWADAPIGSGYTSVRNVFSIDSWFTFEPTPFSTGGRAFEVFVVPTPNATAIVGIGLVTTAFRRRRVTS
ncbi:MAG: hypothetical protein U0640_11510 [Phycisphaerales bacterium]